MSLDFDSVRLDDVSRHFGRRRRASRTSPSPRAAGDIVGLLGPNGAGKSTLIGIMATLAAPTSGDVRFGDTPARALGPELRRRIGLLAHELHLYPELTARQNLEFFAQLYGLPASAAVDPALERAGLADRADDVVSGFSRGMRQRLALERSLLHTPRLVLFDEPFTGLDDRAVSLVSDRLRATRGRRRHRRPRDPRFGSRGRARHPRGRHPRRPAGRRRARGRRTARAGYRAAVGAA